MTPEEFEAVRSFFANIAANSDYTKHRNYWDAAEVEVEIVKEINDTIYSDWLNAQ